MADIPKLSKDIPYDTAVFAVLPQKHLEAMLFSSVSPQRLLEDLRIASGLQKRLQPSGWARKMRGNLIAPCPDLTLGSSGSERNQA